MKTLLILRHAKSSWKDDDLPDHERPLNARGRGDAPEMGRLLVERKLVPDHILCSTARRARNTAELLIAACGYAGELALLPELYAAPPEVYLSELAKLEPDYPTVMVVGHNPGMEGLVHRLTLVYRPMPTAALAVVRLPVAAWSELTLRTRGNLIAVWRPKELD